MDHYRRRTLVSVTMLAATLWLLSGCNKTSTIEVAGDPWGRYRPASHSSILSGAKINVALGRSISAETAKVGDAWHGTLTDYVMTQCENVIPPGSEVEGVVMGVTIAEPGSPAMLELGVRSIRVNGHDESITASAEPVIAGSSRAHKLGAIAGEAAAGDLMGKVMSGVDAAGGSLLGGAAIVGAMARSRGYQFVLSDGTVMSFTADQTVTMR